MTYENGGSLNAAWLFCLNFITLDPVFQKLNYSGFGRMALNCTIVGSTASLYSEVRFSAGILVSVRTRSLLQALLLLLFFFYFRFNIFLTFTFVTKSTYNTCSVKNTGRPKPHRRVAAERRSNRGVWGSAWPDRWREAWAASFTQLKWAFPCESQFSGNLISFIVVRG